jgi:release factor glutamine methyltransferase
LGVSFKLLLTKLNEPVSLPQEKDFRQLVWKRTEEYPLQYLTGTQNFMSLEFEVNERVLIPRWDTEILVEKALELMKRRSNPRVVDVGTGSGAIAVSLAKFNAESWVFALDISPEALDVAKGNASRHRVKERITFLSGDLLEPILNMPKNTLDDHKFKFDLVVSNPPYISRGEIKNLPQDVQKEPYLALDGGEDGLNVYRNLLPQAKKVLKPGGYVLLEIGCDQAEDVKEICRVNGFQNVSVFRDYGGRDRVISGSFKG